MHKTTLPETGFVRLKQILNFLPWSKGTFYSRLRTGAIKLTPIKNGQTVLYRVEEVRELIRQIGGEV